MPYVYDYDEKVNINGVDHYKKMVFVGNKSGKAEMVYEAPKHWIDVDPTKMNYTQDEFIQVCNAGMQNQLKLGAKITLTNTYCGTYEVIGVDHDGTKGTVDLMATTQVGNMTFGSSNNDYQNSSIRTWINGTYYNAFADVIRNIAKTMVVKYATSLTGGVNLNDKVKLLSAVEMNYATFHQYMPGYSSYKEGEPYTIFTRGNYDASIANRWRPAGSYGNSSYYWLRSRHTNYTSSVWFVNSNGYGNGGNNCRNGYGVLPVLRF